MRIPRPSPSSEGARPPMSASWPELLRPAWRTLAGWSLRTPVDYDPPGASDRQPETGARARGSTAAGRHQALGAVRPAATTNAPPVAKRTRVVLLPHPRTEATSTRLNNRPAGRVEDMNQDDSPRHDPAGTNGATRVITASSQWHDAELAMRVARHSFERWLVAGHEDTTSSAIMHAHHTHTALHEAARAITTLIEVLRIEAAALITNPADIPIQRR